MTNKEPQTVWEDPDDAPDLSSSEWRDKIEAAREKREQMQEDIGADGGGRTRTV